MKNDSKLIEDIMAFSKERHDLIEPGYFDRHVMAVYHEGRKYYDSYLLDALNLLHDIVEDTETTLEEINTKYGYIIGDLVWRLTDEDGKNRKERKQKTYWKIRGNNYSLIGKLCDRIVNMRYSLETKSHHGEMYIKEYYTFKCALWEPGYDELWDILDDLYEGLKKQNASRTKNTSFKQQLHAEERVPSVHNSR